LRFDKALIVFRKDWKEIRRSSQVILPIIVLPLIISVLLPVIIFTLSNMTGQVGTVPGGVGDIVRILPGNVKNEIIGMDDQQVIVYIMSVYLFAPFLLIIPLMASSIISSDSFAGEKERKTIEALLATPLSDSELLMGKILVSFVPTMVVTIGSLFVYSTIVDVLAYAMFNGRLLLPNLLWIMLAFGVAPTVALAGIGLTVMISSRVRGFREAQQISVVLLLPIMAIVFGQITGAIFLGPLLVGVLIGVFAVVDVMLFYLSVKVFQREEILSKLV